MRYTGCFKSFKKGLHKYVSYQLDTLELQNAFDGGKFIIILENFFVSLKLI